MNAPESTPSSSKSPENTGGGKFSRSFEAAKGVVRGVIVVTALAGMKGESVQGQEPVKAERVQSDKEELVEIYSQLLTKMEGAKPGSEEFDQASGALESLVTKVEGAKKLTEPIPRRELPPLAYLPHDEEDREEYIEAGTKAFDEWKHTESGAESAKFSSLSLEERISEYMSFVNQAAYEDLVEEYGPAGANFLVKKAQVKYDLDQFKEAGNLLDELESNTWEEPEALREIQEGLKRAEEADMPSPEQSEEDAEALRKFLDSFSESK